MKNKLTLLVILVFMLSVVFVFSACGGNSNINTDTNNENEPQHVHNVVVIPSTEATCEEDGLTSGVKCTECDKILVKQETVKAPTRTHC